LFYYLLISKQEEEKLVSSSEKPKILSIDNYFITEQEDENTQAAHQIVNFINFLVKNIFQISKLIP